MPYSVIPIPGGGTRFEDAPVVQVLGNPNGAIALKIKYNASEITGGHPPVYGEVLFSDVLEYRWQADSVEYEDFPQHEDDFQFGLIEIHNSAYIDNMATKGVRGNLREHRFGAGIKDAEVRHFRMGFDDYGCFDIIALNVLANEVNKHF